MSDQNSKNFIISEIKLPDEIKDSYTVFDHKSLKGQNEHLPNLSKLNLFIGANNSGKSRILRSIMAPELLYINFSNNLISELTNELKETLNSEAGDNTFSDIKMTIERDPAKVNFTRSSQIHVIATLKKMVANKWIKSDLSEVRLIKEMIKKLTTPLDKGIAFVRNRNSNSSYSDEKTASRLKNRIKKKFSNLDMLDVKSFYRIYIPTIRGLRPFDKVESMANYQKVTCTDYYQTRSASDYFPMYEPGKNKQEIFTGLSMFEQVFKHLLSYESERQIIKDFEQFLSENFFEGKEVAIIPNIKEKNNDVLYVKIGNEDEYPIYQLGDGIQQLIIMTFPVFLHQDENVLLFIEEPELYLHPGMQRQLMEILLHHDAFKNVQTYITTHSNHLLDLTLDYDSISVYRFEKDQKRMDTEFKECESKGKPEKEKQQPRFIVHHTDHDDIRLLQSIGVQSSSVFLANCTIWVEGISDRIYLRKYLNLFFSDLNNNPEKYRDLKYYDFKEDIHYAFVEYSGNNITHWSFLDSEEDPINFKRITNQVFLVADQDSNKERRHENLRKKLREDNTAILKCREIENLLTQLSHFS